MRASCGGGKMTAAADAPGAPGHPAAAAIANPPAPSRPSYSYRWTAVRGRLLSTAPGVAAASEAPIAGHTDMRGRAACRRCSCCRRRPSVGCRCLHSGPRKDGRHASRPAQQACPCHAPQCCICGCQVDRRALRRQPSGGASTTVRRPPALLTQQASAPHLAHRRRQKRL